MRTTVKYHIWSRTPSWTDRLQELQRLVAERGFDPDGKGRSTLEETPLRTHEVDSSTQLSDLLRRFPSFESLVSVVSFSPKDGGRQSLLIDIEVRRTVTISVEYFDADVVEGLHARIREAFCLGNPPIEVAQRPLYLQPTVFVGRHFDAESDTAFGTLSTFLALLGFDVREGAQYASMNIPDKVKNLIDRQDIFIALVVGDREHAWMHAEPAYAAGRGKYIVLLVQDGAGYNPTIIGHDREQIRFAGTAVEKAFIPLLRDFRDIRVKGI